MLALPVKNIVGVGPGSKVRYTDSGFLKYFSSGTFFYGFVIFQVAARKRPGAVAMGIFAFTQKNFTIFHYDNSNTYERSGVHIYTRWGKFRFNTFGPV